MAHDSIDAFHAAQAEEDRRICDVLRGEIEAGLSAAEGGVWHAHPVWFIEGNPIVGYSKLKDCVRLLFWSGQGFRTPGLTPEGTFKAPGVQWDYKNIVKRKGRLERLV